MCQIRLHLLAESQNIACALARLDHAVAHYHRYPVLEDGYPAISRLRTQWLVSDLSPTVLSWPATICACHSGSRVTDKIVWHWSQRNWRAGTVVIDTSSRARKGTTIMLGMTAHFGHLPCMGQVPRQRFSAYKQKWPSRKGTATECVKQAKKAPLKQLRCWQRRSCPSGDLPACRTRPSGLRSTHAILHARGRSHGRTRPCCRRLAE